MILLGGLMAIGLSLCAEEERHAKKRVAPVYPDLAKRMHISCAVRMELNVDPEGEVKDVTVLKGHALLRDAAVTAAKTMGIC
jgi:outer membrane biosynthesis protein TonB